MKWISVKDKLPPHKPILVWGTCGMPHVAIYDYDEFCHTEVCSEKYHSPGGTIHFDYWMPLPEVPKDTARV